MGQILSMVTVEVSQDVELNVLVGLSLADSLEMVSYLVVTLVGDLRSPK